MHYNLTKIHLERCIAVKNKCKFRWCTNDAAESAPVDGYFCYLHRDMDQALELDDELNIDLEPIKERLLQRTPGSWCVDPNGRHPAERGYDVYTSDAVIASELYRQDAELIANAPQDIAALVAEVERLQAENAELKSRLDKNNCLTFCKKIFRVPTFDD